MLVLADVERRQTDLAELKVARAINTTFLGTRIWNHFATQPLRGSGQDVVQIGKAVTDVLDVARFPPDVQRIDVDVGKRFLERVKGMLGVPFRAEKSGFFGGRAHEQDRTSWRRRSFWECARQSDDGRIARRVVDRAVKNLIALNLRMLA